MPGAPDEATEPLTGEADAGAIAAPPAEAAPSLIGRTLGKLTIVERLGQGGSGEVFLAEQAPLNRSVVVKVLRREVARVANRVERFLREAKLASRLDHPYAAHVYAFGAEPDGVLWIAMEHVRGETLDHLIARRGAMPASVFAPLFARLCEVVHSAHELGIVHRDIKGANVMVIERAGQLLPKLIDFGIAKGADAGEGGEAAPGVGGADLTQHGITLGSPHYMAPEQWEHPGEVDARADIYGLGALAYRCVAGKLVFAGLDRFELAEAHVHWPPPPLPDAVPAALGDVILRALAKRPADRWPTALALGEAIRSAAGTEALDAVPILDPATREAWLRGGPQPIADAIAHLSAAQTAGAAEAAVRELVAITCRWLALLALASLPEAAAGAADPWVREHARAIVGRDDAGPWLRLARSAAAALPEPLPGLVAALAGADVLARLADELDARARSAGAGRTAALVAETPDALRPLEPLLAYQLVHGRADGTAESWQGPRRRDHEPVVVWGAPLAAGEVALLDGIGRVVLRLSPLAQIAAPLPSAEPELFLLWRSGRGAARLVAAPWGFERDDDAAAVRLAQLTTEDTDTAADPADDRSPYPGLAAYGQGDAEHFVGREREIEAVANRLVRAPLLAVLGPSGVGKSSFVHAGLVPRLREQHDVVALRPGRHPLRALAAAAGAAEGPGDGDGDALVAHLRERGEQAARGLVLVIDQLEELVTLCADRDERAHFAAALAAAASDPGAPIRVVATLRDDFASVIEAEDALRGRFEVFVLATPQPDALRRIVVEPARRAGVAVEPRVVEAMVGEVAGRAASLPLLSFAASQLWQTRDRQAHAITCAAYEALGGVGGALAAYADPLYASLPRREQDTVRDLFARLVAVDGTRIPAPRAELEQLPGARGVLAHLIDARLLVVRDEDGRDVIELVHECLAERWPRLARWRSEDAADRALLADVGVAARRWHDGGRRGDLLWRGRAVGELARLAARSTALTELERAFADETGRAARRTRRLRRGAVVAAMAALGALAAVMAYLGAAANRSRAAAESSAVAARASAHLAEQRLTDSLVAQGRRELNDQRPLPALAYFAAALRRGADSEGLREMIAIADRGRAAERWVGRDRDAFDLTASSDGTFAIAESDGRIAWRTFDGAPAGELATGFSQLGAVRRLADGRLVVCGKEGVELIDAHHAIALRIAAHEPWGAQPGPAPDELTVIERDAITVFGLDGTRRRSVPHANAELDAAEPGWPTGHVLDADGADALELVDLTTMQVRRIAHTLPTPVCSDDGATCAYLDRDHVVHVIDPDGTTRRTFPTTNGANVLVMSSDGTRFAAYADRRLALFDGSGKSLGDVPIEPEGVEVVLRGDDAWSAGGSGTVRHYHAGVLVASHPSHLTGVDRISVAGDAIVTLGSDGSIVVARADEAQLRVAPEVCRFHVEGAVGVGLVFACDDGKQRVYVPGRPVLIYPASASITALADDLAAQRTAIATEHELGVGAAPTLGAFGPDGARLAAITPPAGIGALAFADADHVLAVQRTGLWRWTISTGAYAQVAAVPHASAVAATQRGALVGTGDGAVVRVEDGRVASRVALGAGVDEIDTSPDGRWAAAQLTNGTVAILDAATGAVARTLQPVEAMSGAAQLDPTGSLVVRLTRDGATLWDRATGEELVFGLDLMHDAMAARFLRDGRLALATDPPGVLDLPPDHRPAAQIAAEIACRVPLEVVGSRLEPTTPVCP